jgi:uncharacterized metal-binding protein
VKQPIDVYKLVFLLIAITFLYIIAMNATVISFSKIPTTESNLPIRTKLLDLLNSMYATINLVIGYKLGERQNKP